MVLVHFALEDVRVVLLGKPQVRFFDFNVASVGVDFEDVIEVHLRVIKLFLFPLALLLVLFLVVIVQLRRHFRYEPSSDWSNLQHRPP